MFRILTTKRISEDSWAKKFFHADPESLCQLHNQLKEQRDNLSAARRFTEIVAGIRVGGTYKLTGWNRTVGTTTMIIRHASEFPSINFLDVGGSDGIATWQAMDCLETELNIQVRATMFDLYSELIRFGPRWFCEYRTSGGQPALLRVGPLITRVGQATPDSHLLNKIGNQVYLRMSLLRNLLRETGRVSLVNPIVANNPRIKVEQLSVLDYQTDWDGHFDVVRACNILNPNYFSNEQLKTAVAHLRNYLKPCGLLAISRNHEEQPGAPENASLWRKTRSGLELVDQIGDGSCIADVVAQFLAKTQNEG